MSVERLHRAAASNEAATITTLVQTSKVPVDARDEPANQVVIVECGAIPGARYSRDAAEI